MDKARMRLVDIVLMTAVLVFVFSPAAYSENAVSQGDAEKAGQLGEDFQKQTPWGKDAPDTGEFRGTPQPKEYRSSPEDEQPRDEGQKVREYPLCYNPYTGGYEYCYPSDSYYFRMRFRSPEFRFWWEHGRTCPPGYYFRPGWGCYRR